MEQTAYDAIPYVSLFHEITNPSRLAAAALLAGYSPPDPITARVLDVGCGDGRNAMAIAATLPGTHVVGFDLSSVQIAKGQALIREAGLSNVRLEVGDVFTMPLEGETYDYIIAHGFYSWVPEAVARQTMKLMRARLNPGGIIFISHDTKPTGALKMGLRELLLAMTDHIANPVERLAYAREILPKMAQAQPRTSTYTSALELFNKLYGGTEINFAVHDILAETHRALSALEIEAEAAEAGLTTLGEGAQMSAALTQTLHNSFDPAMVETFGTTAARRSMLLDHIYGRLFRLALFGRADALPPRVEDMNARLEPMWLSTLMQPTALEADEPETSSAFAGPSNNRICTDSRPIVSVLAALSGIRPQEARSEELLALTELPVEEVAEAVRFLVMQDMVMLYVGAPHVPTEIPERPMVSPLHRVIAARDERSVPSSRMTSIAVADAGARKFITLLDGTRTVPELAEAMAQLTGEPADEQRVRGGLAWLYSAGVLQA